MSLTVRQVVESGLRYFAGEQRDIPVTVAGVDDPLPDVLGCLNGALQEMAVLAPTFIYRTRRASAINAAATITIPAVVAGATSFTLTNGNGWQDYFAGCSLRIGTEKWNEIKHRTAANLVHVVNPIESSGSNVSAAVYHDSVTPASDVLRVLSPVVWADHHHLSPAGSLADIMDAQYRYYDQEDFAFALTVGSASQRATVPTTPYRYFVDSHFDVASVTPEQIRIRLAPMPREAGVLQYRARINPTPFVMADIYDSGTPLADPGTEIPVPEQYTESVFLPIFLKRLRGLPYFRNQDVVPELDRQYTMASALLEKMKPQSKAGVRLIPGP